MTWRRGAGEADWTAIISAFSAGVTARGLTFRPPTGDECLALAHDLPVPPRSRVGLGPAEALANLSRKGVAYAVVEDGRLVGLSTLRRCVSDPLVGWAVRRAHRGCGVDARIAAALTEACLGSGAATVLCEAGNRNTRALGLLAAMGYATVAAGPVVTLATTRGSFVPDGGLAPPPPDGPEVCAPVHPEDWVRKAPSPRDTLAEPFDSGGLRLRPARAGDAELLADLAPFGVLPGGDPDGVATFVTAMLATTAVVLATRGDGGPEGAVTVITSSTGEHEIGWAVVPAARRSGLATGMATAVLGRLFETGCPGISCSIDPRNAASIRLAANLGFEPCGIGSDGALGMHVTAATFRNPDAAPLPVAGA